MKKTVKIVGIIMIVLGILIVAAIAIIMGLAAEKSVHYYKYSDATGDIEKKYTDMGSLEVTSREYTSKDDSIKKFVIWYPKNLENETEKYPVVLWANGTGSNSETYDSFFKHLCSHGFIVVGNDDANTRTGASLNAGIDFLISENENKESPLYGKIDLDNIGIGGHSQGGPAVFNMATKQPHADMVKTVYAVSATSTYHTDIYKDGWEYDISKVNVPTFLTAGTGLWDAGTAETKDQKNDDEKGIAQGICPLWSLEENYSALPDSVDKVYGRRINVDHGETHLKWDGYMTAWFSYYLKGDEEAGKAFFGENPELKENQNYQDVNISQALK